MHSAKITLKYELDNYFNNSLLNGRSFSACTVFSSIILERNDTEKSALEWKRYKNNFEEHYSLQDWNSRSFITTRPLRSREEKGGIFKPRKKSCSWKLFCYLFPSSWLKDIAINTGRTKREVALLNNLCRR